MSSDDKAQEAHNAGAHVTVNYRYANAAGHIMAAMNGRGADVIVDVDTTTNAGLITKVVAQDGHVASYGSHTLTALVPVRDRRLKCATLHFMTLYHLSQDMLQAIAHGINAMPEGRRLRHRIAKEFPLADTAAALKQ